MEAKRYFEQNRDYFVSQLEEVVAFPSISTDPAYKDNVLRASKWAEAKLMSLGFSVTVVQTESNPVLLATRIEDPSLPTVLLYGHYDVQPVEPIADWDSEPFKLTKKNGKFFARGVMDNKGQFMMHISAIEATIKAGSKLPVNLKFVIEGDEETGSEGLDRVIKEYASELAADLALISDGEIIGDNIPVIEASFRGVLNCELTVFGPREDMHSGVVGGAVANPAYELSKLLAKLYDESYRVTLPGFYDDVEPISPAEKAAIAKKHGTDEEFLRLTGSVKIQGESSYNRFELTGLRPTLQITGLSSGYTGVGFKNIVPAKATAKFNFRLVVHQNPTRVYDSFKQYIQANLPDSVRFSISNPAGVNAIKIDIESDYSQQVRSILSSVFGHEPEINFVGGTLPVINAIKEHLDIPILCVPLAQEDCGMHSPNERLTEAAFDRGVAFSLEFMNHLKKAD